MKPYFCHGGITIWHGDALEYVEAEPLDDVGLILTDPPYGIKYRSGHNSSRSGPWARWIRDENFPGIVGDDSPFDPAPWLEASTLMAVFGGNYCADRLPPSKCWVVWDKQNGPKQADAELIWTNFNSPTRIYRHLWNGIIREGEENVAREPKRHPHQKPLALLRFLIEIAGPTVRGSIVLDPFMGSGSTLLAARDLGLQAVGVEIEERYCEIAAKRLAQGVFDWGEHGGA